MRLPVRASGRSAGLLFCGVALQILLAVLCDAASADGPLGAAERRDAGNSLSDENRQSVTVASRAAERDADNNLREEEKIDKDNDTNHGGTLRTVVSPKNLVRVCGRDGSTICRPNQKVTSMHHRGPELAIDGDLATTSVTASSTDPWWSVELFASTSVLSVTLTLPGSGTLGPNNVPIVDVTHPLSIYVGDSPDFGQNQRCTADVSRPDSSSSHQLIVPCQGVGRYVHVVMPGNDRVLMLTEVEVIGNHLETAPAASGCPAGYSSWNSGVCEPCPVGWTTNNNVAGPDMWQGCNVPCSATMMNDDSTGCKGAWYKTLSWPSSTGNWGWSDTGIGNSCTAKCAEVGLQCNLQSLRFASTFDRVRSVFELLGESSVCNPPGAHIRFGWSTPVESPPLGWGPTQHTCGGCPKRCGYTVEIQENACDVAHHDAKRMCPCGPTSTATPPPPGRTSTLSLASTCALPLCPSLSPSHTYARAVSASISRSFRASRSLSHADACAEACP